MQMEVLFMNKKTRKVILFCCVALLLLAISFWGGIKYVESSNKKNKPSIDTLTITQELSDISELVTVEYAYTNTVKYDSHIDFYGYRIPFTTNFFLVTYDGVIKAGVDLSKAVINLEGEMITITLPEAQITSHVIDYDSFQSIDETYSFFRPFKITDYTAFCSDQNSKMEKRALDSGLLKKAKDNAIIITSSFITTAYPGLLVTVI